MIKSQKYCNLLQALLIFTLEVYVYLNKGVIIMEYTRRHRGVCSRASYVELDENGVIVNAKIIGGCDGNTRGLAQIVTGLPATFVFEKWKGTPCMFKPTSCPDQFAITIEEALKQLEAEKAAKA